MDYVYLIIILASYLLILILGGLSLHSLKKANRRLHKELLDGLDKSATGTAYLTELQEGPGSLARVAQAYACSAETFCPDGQYPEAETFFCPEAFWSGQAISGLQKLERLCLLISCLSSLALLIFQAAVQGQPLSFFSLLPLLTGLGYYLFLQYEERRGQTEVQSLLWQLSRRLEQELPIYRPSISLAQNLRAQAAHQESLQRGQQQITEALASFQAPDFAAQLGAALDHCLQEQLQPYLQQLESRGKERDLALQQQVEAQAALMASLSELLRNWTLAQREQLDLLQNWTREEKELRAQQEAQWAATEAHLSRVASSWQEAQQRQVQQEQDLVRRWEHESQQAAEQQSQALQILEASRSLSQASQEQMARALQQQEAILQQQLSLQKGLEEASKHFGQGLFSSLEASLKSYDQALSQSHERLSLACQEIQASLAQLPGRQD